MSARRCGKVRNLHPWPAVALADWFEWRVEDSVQATLIYVLADVLRTSGHAHEHSGMPRLGRQEGNNGMVASADPMNQEIMQIPQNILNALKARMGMGTRISRV